MSNKAHQLWSRYLDQQTRLLQKNLLNIAEVVIPPINYAAFRSKVLGMTNDFKRDLDRELSLNYNISYDPTTICEDVVEIVSFNNQKLKYTLETKAARKDKNGNK